MIKLTPRDRGVLAGIMQARTGVPMLEAFDIVDACTGALDRLNYTLLPDETAQALTAAGAQLLDPHNAFIPMPDRAVLRQHMADTGMDKKMGDVIRWTINP